MDHVVYVDHKTNELEKLLDGSKKMIIRGAAGRKMPHGRVNPGDVLYLINNNAEGFVLARAVVTSVFSSEKMITEDSHNLVKEIQPMLQLTLAQMERWSGKRYLVIIEVSQVEKIEPFLLDKSGYSNMDDWLFVKEIALVRRSNKVNP